MHGYVNKNRDPGGCKIAKILTARLLRGLGLGRFTATYTHIYINNSILKCLREYLYMYTCIHLYMYTCIHQAPPSFSLEAKIEKVNNKNNKNDK